MHKIYALVAVGLGLALAGPVVAQTSFEDLDKQDRAAAEARVAKMGDLSLSEGQRAKLVDKLAAEQAQQRRDGALGRVGLHPQTFSSLGLDADQNQRVDAVLDKAGKALIGQWLSQQKPGAEKWGYPRWRAFIVAMRGRVNHELGELMTDEQRAKYGEMSAQWDAAAKRHYEDWERSEKGREAREARQAEKDADAKEVEAGRQRETADAEVARRLAAALKALKALGLSAEEASAMSPLIEQLIRHRVLTRRGLARRRAELQKRGGDAEAARRLLEAFRRYRAERTRDLGPLEQAVRELLTVPQEAVMVAQDVLSH